MLRPWFVLTFIALLCVVIAVVLLWPWQEREPSVVDAPTTVSATPAVTSDRIPEKEEVVVSHDLPVVPDARAVDSATGSVVDEETLLSRAYWAEHAEKVKHEVIAMREKYVELEKTQGKVIREEGGKKHRVLISDEKGEPCAVLAYRPESGILRFVAEYRITESQKKIDAEKDGFAPSRAVPIAGAAQHGFAVSYNPAGHPRKVDQWVDNKLHGIRYFYTNEGDVRYVAEMVNHHFLGANVDWDTDGNPSPASRIVTEPIPFLPSARSQ